MTLYFILSALVLAVSAGITFYTRVVSYKQFSICLFLFPIVYLLCKLPLADIANHLLAAGIIYTTGSFLRWIKVGIGGGVVHAFTIAALWIPTFTLLFEYMKLAFIVGGAVSLIVMYLKNSDSRVDHYAAFALATCSGFLLFQYNEYSPATVASYDVQAKSQMAIEASRLELRGLSETE